MRSGKITKAMIWIVIAAYFFTASQLEVGISDKIAFALPFLFLCFLLSIKLKFIDRVEVNIEPEEPKIDWLPKDDELPPEKFLSGKTRSLGPWMRGPVMTKLTIVVVWLVFLSLRAWWQLGITDGIALSLPFMFVTFCLLIKLKFFDAQPAVDDDTAVLDYGELDDDVEQE